MNWKLLLALPGLFLVSSSHGIIVRHDVAPGAYVISNAELPAVFFLERRGMRRVCAATLIHAQWAITAAHCIHETSLGEAMNNRQTFAVEVGNVPRAIDAVLPHPAIDDMENPAVDLALLRFSEPSAIPRPIQPYTESNEDGAVVTLVGWGYFGLGTTGKQFADGAKRRAHNRISTAGARLRYVFDDPRNGGGESLPLEGTLGLGDSGGPALMETAGGYRLAGVAIGELSGGGFSEETQGKYGSVAVYERISLHMDWINSVIAAGR